MQNYTTYQCVKICFGRSWQKQIYGGTDIGSKNIMEKTLHTVLKMGNETDISPVKNMLQSLNLMSTKGLECHPHHVLHDKSTTAIIFRDQTSTAGIQCTAHMVQVWYLYSAFFFRAFLGRNSIPFPSLKGIYFPSTPYIVDNGIIALINLSQEEVR